MSYLDKTGTLQRVARAFYEDLLSATNMVHEQELFDRLRIAPISTDARDFVPMVAMLGIKGETREERDQDIRNKLDELTRAFSDDDHSAREFYLNMLYDLRDGLDPREVDMDDPEQVANLLHYFVLDQTYSKKRGENEDYYNKRYPTLLDKNVADAHEKIITLVSARLVTHCAEFGLVFQLDLTLPPPLDKDMVPYRNCSEPMAFRHLEEAIAIREGAEPAKTKELLITEKLLQNMDKDPHEAENLSYKDEAQLFQYYMLCIEDAMLPSTGKVTEGLREAQMRPFDAVYIDGKTADEFCRELFPEGAGGSTPKNCAAIALALVSGRHRIDVVNSFRDDEGNLQFEAKSVKPQIRPEDEEAYMRKFSWIHRVLFNWGPFRIEPYQSKMERVMDFLNNDTEEAERHAAICENLKGKVESECNRIKAERERSDARTRKLEERKQGVEKEVKRLQDSVNKWEPDSVIRIVGEEVKDSYGPIQKMMVLPYRERYEKLSVPFAKQVIYSRMCIERVQNGNLPGETELQLAGDGTRDVVLQNLDKAAQDLAANPLFNRLVHDKFEGPSPVYNGVNELLLKSFQEFMCIGGCARFAEEYMNLEQAAKQMELPPDGNEPEKVNEMANENVQEAPQQQNIMAI